MRTTNDQAPGARTVKLIAGRSMPLWVGLILVSAVPRILGAFLLPNAFGDATSYLEAIDAMRSKMADGTFAIKDLYGFWFPMYQVACAFISFLFGHTIYVARLVSALCGAGVCLLVYRISLRLTDHRPLSLLAFALVALNPLHILYSSSPLTDIPHGFLAISSLYFALENRWKTAAIFAAVAGFMRIESWMLIVLLPALQYVFQRRVSLVAPAIMIISPLFWLYICWVATGDALAYFEARNRYLAEYAAANPAVTTFSFRRLLLDGGRLLFSTNLATLCGCLVAAWMIVRRMIAKQAGWRKIGIAAQGFAGVIAACVFFFSYLGFLLLAYFTGGQPDIWTRYGLIFFTLGLPVAAWAFLAIDVERPRSKIILNTAILIIFACHTKGHIGEVISCLGQKSARAAVAAYLEEMRRNDPSLRIYCDDGDVRFLSGIPSDRFLTAHRLPADSSALLKLFDEAGVKYVVCTNWEVSVLTRLFPEVRRGKDNGVFHPVKHVRSKLSRLELWIYRFR